MGAKTVPRGAKPHVSAYLHLKTTLYLHFAPIRSVVQNPHCHFSMDDPIGSFSPVQGDNTFISSGKAKRPLGPRTLLPNKEEIVALLSLREGTVNGK